MAQVNPANSLALRGAEASSSYSSQALAYLGRSIKPIISSVTPKVVLAVVLLAVAIIKYVPIKKFIADLIDGQNEDTSRPSSSRPSSSNRTSSTDRERHSPASASCSSSTSQTSRGSSSRALVSSATPTEWRFEVNDVTVVPSTPRPSGNPFNHFKSQMLSTLRSLSSDWYTSFASAVNRVGNGPHLIKAVQYGKVLYPKYNLNSLSSSASEILPGIFLSGKQANAVSISELSQESERFNFTYSEHNRDEPYGGVVNCFGSIEDAPTSLNGDTMYLGSSSERATTKTDFTADNLLRVIRYLDTTYQANGSVLVHCADGCSRSPAVLAVWLSLRTGLDLEQVYQFIRVKRLNINFNDPYFVTSARLMPVIRQRYNAITTGTNPQSPEGADTSLRTRSGAVSAASSTTRMFDPNSYTLERVQVAAVPVGCRVNFSDFNPSRDILKADRRSAQPSKLREVIIGTLNSLPEGWIDPIEAASGSNDMRRIKLGKLADPNCSNVALCHTASLILPGIFLSGFQAKNISRSDIALEDASFKVSYLTHEHSGVYGGVVNCDRREDEAPQAMNNDIHYLNGNPSISAGQADFTVENLLKVARYLDSAYEDKGSVLVHCAQGCDRSPAVLASWLALRTGLKLEHVYEYIYAKRLIINIEDSCEHLAAIKRIMQELRDRYQAPV